VAAGCPVGGVPVAGCPVGGVPVAGCWPKLALVELSAGTFMLLEESEVSEFIRARSTDVTYPAYIIMFRILVATDVIVPPGMVYS
jgi:hypothetical protein